MSVSKLLSAASGAASGGGLDVDDVYSTFLYTGNGSTQTITNNIDLAGEGGLVFIKRREGSANNWGWYDTVRGPDSHLKSNAQNAENTQADVEVKDFNSDGFDLGADHNAFINTNGGSFCSWTFRKADKFFDLKSVSHTNGSTTTLDFSSLGTIGMGIAKRVDSSGEWFVQHRADTSKQILLNSSATATTAETDFGISGTNFRLHANAPSGTYIVYCFAHNDDDGEFGSSGDQDIINCGSYTGAASTSSPTVDLGFEPQFVLTKRLNATGNWIIQDNMRNGVNLTSSDMLFPNLSNAATTATTPTIAPNSSGFTIVDGGTNYNASGETYIFMAIRRGSLNELSATNKAFKVLHPKELQGTKITTGFALDMQIATYSVFAGDIELYDRLRGVRTGSHTFNTPELVVNGGGAESTNSSSTQGVDNTGFETSSLYHNSDTIYWNWKRAKGFFDIVEFVGDGSAGNHAHSLGVAPEMFWIRSRGSASWAVFHASHGATKGLFLNDSGTGATTSGFFNDTAPTASVFTVGASFNQASSTMCYLFGSLAGISKCGGYTGNGSSQTINCGFSSGSSYVLIKRTDNAGGWHAFDSARGIVAGNEQALLYNDASKVDNTDSIDPDNSGFIVNQNTTTNLNDNGATYIFYAIAA